MASLIFANELSHSSPAGAVKLILAMLAIILVLLKYIETERISDFPYWVLMSLCFGIPLFVSGVFWLANRTAALVLLDGTINAAFITLMWGVPVWIVARLWQHYSSRNKRSPG